MVSALVRVIGEKEKENKADYLLIYSLFFDISFLSLCVDGLISYL